MRANESPTPGVTVDGASAHLAQYPAGSAAVVDIKEHGHDGELVWSGNLPVRAGDALERAGVSVRDLLDDRVVVGARR